NLLFKLIRNILGNKVVTASNTNDSSSKYKGRGNNLPVNINIINNINSSNSSINIETINNLL
ncbi:hypothetical protein OFC47_24950, partial [Escherichia coli]|nr:hypothetical protein [Escherichia coli]